jgi:hypothetical protein
MEPIWRQPDRSLTQSKPLENSPLPFRDPSLASEVFQLKDPISDAHFLSVTETRARSGQNTTGSGFIPRAQGFRAYVYV